MDIDCLCSMHILLTVSTYNELVSYAYTVRKALSQVTKQVHNYKNPPRLSHHSQCNCSHCQ